MNPLKGKKVYLAHTYGRRHGLSDEECERNTEKSIEIGRMLIKLGAYPYIPNLFHYVHKDWEDSPDEVIYFDLVAIWIQFCDVLLVGELPAWEDSGVHREIEMAKNMGKPVYYWGDGNE